MYIEGYVYILRVECVLPAVVCIQYIHRNPIFLILISLCYAFGTNMRLGTVGTLEKEVTWKLYIEIGLCN